MGLCMITPVVCFLLIVILASLCHNEPVVKTELDQVCDMYIKQNSTFVSEVIIEAAASQKIWE